MPARRPSSHTVSGRRSARSTSGAGRHAMPGWGTWVPRRAAGARPSSGQPSAEVDHVDHVQPAVVGVASRRDVPRAEELGVHGRHDLTPPPRPPGHEVARGTTARRPSSTTTPRSTVNSATSSRQVLDGARPPPSVRRRSPPSSPTAGSGAPVPPGPRRPARRPPASSADLDHVGGRGTRRPQSWPRRIVTPGAVPDRRRCRRRRPRPRRWPSTPRRRPGTGGRPPAAPTARVSSTGASRASWRSRSMSCFIVRTKSPPDSSSSSTTVAKDCPAAQAWATRDERRVGRPGHREAGLLLGVAQLGGQRLDGLPPLADVPGREPRRRRRAPGCGARS